MTTPSPSSRLQNKVAIITGAASGFGLAITHLFASHGCSIVASDLNESLLHSHFPADSSRQPASARVDGRIVGIVADVASREDWDRLVKTARDRFGGLDIVVNNAGTSYRNKVRLWNQGLLGVGSIMVDWPFDLCAYHLWYA
jgi:3-oxoacyl-[acyl-carrier protein] reductase